MGLDESLIILSFIRKHRSGRNPVGHLVSPTPIIRVPPGASFHLKPTERDPKRSTKSDTKNEGYLNRNYMWFLLLKCRHGPESPLETKKKEMWVQSVKPAEHDGPHGLLKDSEDGFQ